MIIADARLAKTIRLASEKKKMSRCERESAAIRDQKRIKQNFAEDSKAALVSQQAGKFPLESAVPQSVFDVWDRSSQIRQALFKSEYSEFAGFGEDFLVLLAHFFGNFFSRCKLGEFHVVTCRAESLHKRLRTCLWKTGVGKRK